MEGKEILGFAIDRASAINTYWSLYTAVATGLVGIMSSAKVPTNNNTPKSVLVVAFVVFAWSNLAAILRLGKLRAALLTLLPPDVNGLHDSLAPAPPWQYIALHVVLDVLVVAAIWFVPWPSSR